MTQFIKTLLRHRIILRIANQPVSSAPRGDSSAASDTLVPTCSRPLVPIFAHALVQSPAGGPGYSAAGSLVRPPALNRPHALAQPGALALIFALVLASFLPYAGFGQSSYLPQDSKYDHFLD